MADENTDGAGGVRSRFLKDEDEVMDYNAWDDVEWTEEAETQARTKVESDVVSVTDAARDQYDALAAQYWDKFYQNNKNNFFKDRHYLHLEFQTLASARPDGDRLVVLECGCGAGNTIFPLLETNPTMFIYAFDFSQSAVDLVKSNPAYDESRCLAFRWDIAKDPVPAVLQSGSVDCAMLIYMLSAVKPEESDVVLQKLFQVMKPGGSVFLRDYGRYDLTQLRFKTGRKLQDNFYVRGDGTQVYFFTLEELGEAFSRAGFRIASNKYDRRLLVNRKRNLKMYRVWLQGQFVKAEAAGVPAVEA